MTEGVRRSIRHLAFDEAAVAAVAETLGVPVDLAPFTLPGGRVYQVVVPGTNGRPTVLVTLWPSLRRVDAIASPATVVFTAVSLVTLVEGIEALFRRENNDYLIVARGGKVIVRA